VRKKKHILRKKARMNLDEIAAKFGTKISFLEELQNYYGGKKPIKIRQKRGTGWKDSSRIDGTFLNCLKAMTYGGKCGKTAFQANIKLQKALKKMSKLNSLKRKKKGREMISDDMNKMVGNFATKRRMEAGKFPETQKIQAVSASLTAPQRLALQFSYPKDATKKDLLEMFNITGTPRVSKDMSVEELRRRAEELRDNQTDGDLLLLAKTFSNSETDVSEEIMDDLRNRLETSKSNLSSIKEALQPIVKRLKEMASDPLRVEAERKEIEASIRTLESVQRRGEAGGFEVQTDSKVGIGAKIGAVGGVALGAAAVGVAVTQVNKKYKKIQAEADKLQAEKLQAEAKECDKLLTKIYTNNDQNNITPKMEVQSERFDALFENRPSFRLVNDNVNINVETFKEALDLSPFQNKVEMKDITNDPVKLDKYISILKFKVNRNTWDKGEINNFFCLFDAYMRLKWEKRSKEIRETNQDDEEKLNQEISNHLRKYPFTKNTKKNENIMKFFEDDETFNENFRVLNEYKNAQFEARLSNDKRDADLSSSSQNLEPFTPLTARPSPLPTSPTPAPSRPPAPLPTSPPRPVAPPRPPPRPPARDPPPSPLPTSPPPPVAPPRPPPRPPARDTPPSPLPPSRPPARDPPPSPLPPSPTPTPSPPPPVAPSPPPAQNQSPTDSPPLSFAEILSKFDTQK